MRSTEKSGKSVEEAVALALEELGADSSRVEVEVLEEARGGLFGFLGTRQATVRVRMKVTADEGVADYFRALCVAGAVEAEVGVRRDDDHLKVEITGGKASGLIGHRGQTVEALQLLGNLVSRKTDETGEGPRVIVDVEGYRRRREETLIRLAERLAERVERSRQPVSLEPMSAQDRRIIHMTLAEHPRVSTGSEGEDPYRRVVIAPRAPR